jgi:hypothetical protein
MSSNTIPSLSTSSNGISSESTTREISEQCLQSQNVQQDSNTELINNDDMPSPLPSVAVKIGNDSILSTGESKNDANAVSCDSVSTDASIVDSSSSESNLVDAVNSDENARSNSNANANDTAEDNVTDLSGTCASSKIASASAGNGKKDKRKKKK